MHLLQELCVFAHVGSELLHDHVDLSVVEITRNFLVKEQVIEHILVSAQVRHRLFLANESVVSGRGNILVLLDLVREIPESRTSHIRVRLILVLVLEKGVAEGIGLTVYGKIVEAHVCELCLIVDIIGCLHELAECGQSLFGLGTQIMGLCPDDLAQLLRYRAADAHRLFEHRAVRLDDLGIYKAGLCIRLGRDAVGLVGIGYLLRIGVVGLHVKAEIIAYAARDLIHLFAKMQTVYDRLRIL